MESIILSRKPKFYNERIDEEMVDISYQSIEYKDHMMSIKNSFNVSEDMEMRPDLASYAAYRTTEYWDLVLKFNGISNPFSLSKEDFLFCPDVDYMKDQLYVEKPKLDKLKEKIRRQYYDPGKKAEIDPNRKVYENKLRQQLQGVKLTKITKETYPPNFNQHGTTSASVYKKQDGTNAISLGESY